MVDYNVEVIVLPVSDVDRAVDFYTRIGFRLDVDRSEGEGFRVVHLTPPGSQASFILGDGVSDAAPGSVEGVHLVVSDIEAASDELAAAGVEVSEIFHDSTGLFHHAGTRERVGGPNPDRRSYSSFLSFTDPDGNGFVVQEVTSRHPDRISHVVYRSVDEVEAALRDAALAHGRYERDELDGQHDENWPAWYAAHMSRATGLGV